MSESAILGTLCLLQQVVQEQKTQLKHFDSCLNAIKDLQTRVKDLELENERLKNNSEKDDLETPNLWFYLFQRLIKHK
jgi:hypothetical protein